MTIQLQGSIGCSGAFQLVRMDCRALEGSGRDGAIQFSDLFETDPVTHMPVHGPDGWPIPKQAERINQRITVKNKFTKRGLGRMLHEILTGHNNGPYIPSDISYDPTDNPFEAFFCTGDSPTTDGKYGDARVQWNESDGQFDSAISAYNTTPTEGKRAVALSDTSGVFKRLTIEYRNTNPYGEAEFVFFAQPNSYVAATGSLTFDTQANHTDGETFTLDDGVHPPVTFELDKTGDGVGLNTEPVNIVSAVTADDVRDAALESINRLIEGKLDILAVASVTTGRVNLTNERGGAAGNVTITHTMSAGGWSFSGMAGGSSSYETGIKGMDNFIMKGCGLAAGTDCGDGEAESQVGIRAVLGLAPTLQGISDRVYVHEGKNLLKYVYPDLNTTITAEGYLASSEASEVQIGSDIAGTASDSMTATTNVIKLWNAYFNQNHVRKTLRVSNSSVGGNNRDYTIKRIIAYNEVEVFETVASTVTENFMTTGDGLYEKYTGDKAFDGRVENEGRVGSYDGDNPGTIVLGEKWVSTDSSGPHTVGRVFTTSKTLTGIRVTFPAGVNKDFCPNTFKVQILDPSANSGNPRPGNDADWVTMLDYSASSQATNIYDAGVYGYEYTFAGTAAKGIRLKDIQALSSTRKTQVAVLYAFTAMTGVSFTNGVDKLRLATDGVPIFKEFDLPGMTSTTSVSTIVSSLNQKLRGFQMEAVRSTFGYLWLRGTVAGSRSYLDIDSVVNGSNANTKLGFGSAASQKQGITQSVIKWPGEALTIIYRVNITGNVPGGYA